MGSLEFMRQTPEGASEWSATKGAVEIAEPEKSETPKDPLQDQRMIELINRPISSETDSLSALKERKSEVMRLMRVFNEEWDTMQEQKRSGQLTGSESQRIEDEMDRNKFSYRALENHLQKVNEIINGLN